MKSTLSPNENMIEAWMVATKPDHYAAVKSAVETLIGETILREMPRAGIFVINMTVQQAREVAKLDNVSAVERRNRKSIL